MKQETSVLNKLIWVFSLENNSKVLDVDTKITILVISSNSCIVMLPLKAKYSFPSYRLMTKNYVIVQSHSRFTETEKTKSGPLGLHLWF